MYNRRHLVHRPTPLLVIYQCLPDAFEGQRVGWYREEPGFRIFKEPGTRIFMIEKALPLIRFLSSYFFKPAMRALGRKPPYSKVFVYPPSMDEKFFLMTSSECLRMKKLMEKNPYLNRKSYLSMAGACKDLTCSPRPPLLYFRIVSGRERCFHSFLKETSSP